MDFASKYAQHPTSPNKCSVKSLLLLVSLGINMILLIYLLRAPHQAEIGISSEYHSPLERIKRYYIRKHDGVPQEGSFHDGNVRDRDHVIQQQPAAKSSVPHSNNKPNNKTHWCVITHAHIPFFASRYFKHFPHTAETLLPCWSYFYEKQVHDRCGVHLNLGRHIVSPWIRELIEDVMKCKLLDEGKPPRRDVQYIPNLYLMRPRFEYIRFLNDPEHAHALRRNIISDDQIFEVKGGDKPLQIGIIQRPDSRRVDNLEDIRDALQIALPDAVVDMTDFNFTTLKEQAWYFASKDVIVGPHGAAFTNAVFITPKTIVLQMYPSGYYFQFFESLIEQSGGIALDWHNKTAGNPYMVYKNHHNSDIPKKSHFLVPPEDIVERVMYSLGKKLPNRDEINDMYGNAYSF